MKRKKHTWIGLLRGLLLPVAAVAVLVFFAVSLDNLDSGRSAEGLRQLETAIQRGCVACYATEGIYPPDLDYLKEHYGIQVDEARYMVDYQIFASNLMPDITVLERKS